MKDWVPTYFKEKEKINCFFENCKNSLETFFRKAKKCNFIYPITQN